MIFGTFLAIPGGLAADAFLTRYCHTVRVCLAMEAPRCRDVPAVPAANDGDVPEARRCDPARQLHKAGVDAQSQSGIYLYSFLGRPYLLEYQIQGEVDVSPHKLAYLLDHLPLAARLVKHFSGSPYFADYVTRGNTTWVKGGRGERFYGEAQLLTGQARLGKLVYLGYGTANIAKWSFTGDVLLDFVFQADPENSSRTLYRIDAVAAPGSAVVNTVMDSAPFRYVTARVIAAIVDDLADTAGKTEQAYTRGEFKEGEWTAGELRRIQRLVGLK